MLEKLAAVADAIVKVAVAVALLLGVLANVLPDGRLKIFCSYAGMRLFRGIEEYRRLATKRAEKDGEKS